MPVCPSNSLKKRLETGLSILGITQTIDSEALLTYLSLLYKWNRAYNLTAVRDIETMVARHLLDSLAILRWVEGKSILDVGTGAGLPGIPLAISCPDKQVNLIDSCGKKTFFLQEVKRVLGLKNIEILHGRVEAYRPEQAFDTIVSRALSEVPQALIWTQHLFANEGKWLFMKGKTPQEEVGKIAYAYKLHHYKVPFIDAERCCVIVDTSASIPCILNYQG